MRFVLCRAVARCQARRLRAACASAPLPAALAVALVALAPLALARVGETLGSELAGAVTSSRVATALVLGPCLAAAASGAVLATSLPLRAGLGHQIAACPCSDRCAIGAGLALPSALAALIVVPSLLGVSIGLAGAFPGGHPAGVALVAAILAAVLVGAVAAEGTQVAVRGRRIRLVGMVVGLFVWVAAGSAMGAAPLGLLAPVSLALRGTLSAWIAMGVAGALATGLGIVWILLATGRPEQRHRVPRRRSLPVARRFPVLVAVSSLIVRRSDVRRAAGAALGFGITGVVVAVASGAAAPGPFLLATTTTLFGSLVAALVGWGVVGAGTWIWRGAPRGRRTTSAVVWQVGLVATAAPVGLVAAVAAVGSGVDPHTAGVVVVLVVAASALATIAGSLVPWEGQGIGDQLSSFAAFMGVALAASVAVGLVAPRLTGLGLPDAALAVSLGVLSSGMAIASLRWRLEGGAR